ncbi:MAG: universal stress protein [Methanoculleaceae archaeon]
MKILVLMDGSMWSHKAALYAAAIARKKKAEVVVFSVLDREDAKSISFKFCMESGLCDRITQYEEQIWRDMRRHLRDDVQSVTSHLLREGISCSSRIVEGDTEEEIIAEATKGGYSLVVMAAYGKNGSGKMGNLLTKIGGRIDIPLLVVR